MKRILALYIAVPILSFLSLAPTLLAHHSTGAVYDLGTQTELKGAVTSVAWLNPHASFLFTSTDQSTWEIELSSPNSLQQEGWTRDTLRKGDTVTIVFYPAKDGSHKGSVIAITFPDGRTMKINDHWMGIAGLPKQ
ncbi:MAG: DUF6152 family protein [Acidobacteriota bacterium]